MHKPLKALKQGAFLLLSVVVMLEILIRLTDPLGAAVEFDKATMMGLFIDDPRGYGYTPGVHIFSGWQMTVNAYGNRITPDTNADGERVVFIGDSVSVGWGVNDDQTFANLLAKDLRLNATNRAVNGYNMPNILRTLQSETCTDCVIVYLVIGNDANRTFDLSDAEEFNPSPLMLSYYLRPNPLRTMDAPVTPEDEVFWSEFEQVVSDPRVLTFAFDDELTREAVRRGYPVIVIPAFSSRISHLDPHPDAAGHREIAAEIKPYLTGRFYGSSIDR